ncbi:endonuclease domain-containing protein [Azospirillum sp.]|uniref:endonuclease domain-containing protein n=1 Tax=Azospirillum sp. TaxID=34012 RepID=UPI003D71C01A
MRDSKLKYRVRELRTQPTDAEKTLWRLLRQGQLGGWRFRRQHAESSYDEKRDRYLRSLGWRVLRFWNPDILTNPEGVAETILPALSDPDHLPPPLTPPPLRRGGG